MTFDTYNLYLFQSNCIEQFMLHLTIIIRMCFKVNALDSFSEFLTAYFKFIEFYSCSYPAPHLTDLTKYQSPEKGLLNVFETYNDI